MSKCKKEVARRKKRKRCIFFDVPRAALLINIAPVACSLGCGEMLEAKEREGARGARGAALPRARARGRARVECRAVPCCAVRVPQPTAREEWGGFGFEKHARGSVSAGNMKKVGGAFIEVWERWGEDAGWGCT